jgi:enoyl-[acyl-carrier-protein] reductase (NADH)
MSDLFEQALQDPALLAAAANALKSAAGNPIVESPEAVAALIERAQADPVFKSTLAGALQQVAAQSGHTFNPQGNTLAAASVTGIEAHATTVQFKAHKDNPTQSPISRPIALIFVGAALIFLPSVFGVSGMDSSS